MMFPVLRSFHAGQKAFNREEGGGEIAVDRCSPLLLARLLDGPGCGEAAAGIGDEDVDRAEFAFDPPAHGFDIAELGDVPGHTVGLPAGPCDVRQYRGQRLLIPPVKRHLCSFARE
jgi:hypothetical protein